MKSSSVTEEKVTYLLGAGASYEAVPVANAFAKTMQQWVAGPATSMPDSVRHHPQFESFVQHIQELSVAAEREGGIDAYARVLTLSQRAESIKKLRALKATLSCWLLARQRGGKIDKRYVHFLGALARGGAGQPVTFDHRVNVVTWNYDLQIELVCSLRLGVPEDQVVSVLNAPPPEYDQEIRIDPSGFFVARLNGFAGAHRLGPSHAQAGRFQRVLGLVFHKDSFRSMIEILDLFGKYLDENDLVPAIDFAWESQSMWSKHLEHDVDKALKQTTHLVIIGYSFPAFNADVDRRLLSAMTPTNVIIQDPNSSEVAGRLLDLVPEWKSHSVSLRSLTRCDSFEVVSPWGG
jgi:hypothetical protein